MGHRSLSHERDEGREGFSEIEGGCMPTRRFRLNKAERRAAAQKLYAQGLISKIPDWLRVSLVLDIRIDPMASEVAELPSGQVYYALWVELVARQAGLILVDCRITTSWDDQIVLASDEANRFCSPGGPAYSSDGALNGRIENALRFRRRGDLVRGTIFAWGLRPIPNAYRSDALVPFELTFTDSLGNEFAKQGTLRVNRWRTRKAPIPKESLYAGVVTDSESISDRQRRAYLEVCAEKLANSPNRIRIASVTYRSSATANIGRKLPNSRPLSDQQVNGAEGGPTAERKNATVQDRGPINKG
jgi:hypothetical protein